MGWCRITTVTPSFTRLFEVTRRREVCVRRVLSFILLSDRTSTRTQSSEILSPMKSPRLSPFLNESLWGLGSVDFSI